MNAQLTKAGAYKVERLHGIPNPGQPVNLDAPPKGILHTTEGTFESALAVFQQHYAPHFMVGRDHAHRTRILQLIPLGTMAAALENHPGGVETNRVVRVQIEIVGESQRTPWLPDSGVTDALASLMAELEVGAGIPLRHAPNPDRDPAKWVALTGWAGHCDVPENSHWDPGALKWPVLMSAAQSKQTREPAGPPPDAAGVSAKEWLWRQWRFGEGAFAKYAPGAGPRPKVGTVPVVWKDRAITFLLNR